ncbi:signal recognition particle protein [Bdellovibrionota bacterium]
MFESLSEKITAALRKLRNEGRITEKHLDATLREIRMSLLEADVNFKVAKDFIEKVREKALGRKILQSLTFGQQIQKIVHEELAALLGGEKGDLNLMGRAPHVLMLVGLQGSGKTTTVAKLAQLLKGQGRHPYLVPADVYRPAAIEQLQTLGSELGMPVYPSRTKDNPVKIAQKGVKEAEKSGCDVVLIDTAGRLHIDEPLMKELRKISEKVSPQEILLVADAMTGQDAVTVAEQFHKQLQLTGAILTKMEGDARGGAALSIRAVAGCPIKFIGVGEKVSDLEVFHPDRVASRILDLGDLLSLVEKAESAFDVSQAEELEKKLKKQEFTLEDFRDQLRNVKKLGSLESVIKMIPGMGKMAKKMAKLSPPEEEIKRTEAIINSMTSLERRKYEILNASRRQRIAAGSGTTVANVNRLIKQFREMQKLMKQMARGGLKQFGFPF